MDAFRHAIERLDRTAYLDDGYYGRWLNAAELMLTESAVLAPAAIDARARNLRGEQVEEPPIPEPAKPDYAPTAEGSLRTVDAAPAFAAGERVRAKNISPAGHTRLPRYVRGHTGVVALIQPGIRAARHQRALPGREPAVRLLGAVRLARAVGRRRRTVRTHHRDVRELSGEDRMTTSESD